MSVPSPIVTSFPQLVDKKPAIVAQTSQPVTKPNSNPIKSKALAKTVVDPPVNVPEAAVKPEPSVGKKRKMASSRPSVIANDQVVKEMINPLRMAEAALAKSQIRVRITSIFYILF
jgi:hypothetical protein